MGALSRYFCSGVGRKKIMAVTGLMWSLFVLSHMLGNLLILVGAEAYNKYSHAIVSNPFLIIAEAGLVVTLLIHAINGIQLTFRNRSARGDVGYAVTPKGAKAASPASKTMIFHGTMILIFIVLHIATFKYGAIYTATYGGIEMRDLHKLIVEVFQSPGYVAWYILCLVLLGFHLSHGMGSMFHSLGFHHPKWSPMIKCFAIVYGLIVSLGFIVQPIYVYLIYKGS